jgi:hypothetical protein
MDYQLDFHCNRYKNPICRYVNTRKCKPLIPNKPDDVAASPVLGLEETPLSSAGMSSDLHKYVLGIRFYLSCKHAKSWPVENIWGTVFASTTSPFTRMLSPAHLDSTAEIHDCIDEAHCSLQSVVILSLNQSEIL